MIRRPPRSTLDRSSAASDVYKRQQHACCDKFAIIRQIKISVAPAFEPSTTASPLDNVQKALPLVRSTFPEKEGISEQFSNLLLRYHCFETRYLFKWTEGWLEHLLGLPGILLGCSWVTGTTNQSQETPKCAQHAVETVSYTHLRAHET